MSYIFIEGVISMTVLKLKEFRIKHKLSQIEVSEKMGVTQSCYSLWELGKRLPDAKQIIKLCNVFKCTPNDLFGFKGVHQVVGETLREE